MQANLFITLDKHMFRIALIAISVLMMIFALVELNNHRGSGSSETLPATVTTLPPAAETRAIPSASDSNSPKVYKYTAYISPGYYGREGHIMNRHWYNATTTGPTSRFTQNMTLEKLQALATITINNAMPKNGGKGRLIYEYRFDEIIGTTSRGQPAHKLRVVIEPKKSDARSKFVITAFPVK